MKLSDRVNVQPDSLNVRFESMRHRDLNFEDSGSNALSVAWTKLLKVESLNQTFKLEKELLIAALYLLLSTPAPTMVVHLNYDTRLILQNTNTLRFPYARVDTSTQIHFAFELQEGVSYEQVNGFLRTIATEHFEVNHHVTALSIAITKKNDKNIVVAIDTVHNEEELMFLMHALTEVSDVYFPHTHLILQRVLSRMIIAYISKESIRYIEESTTDSVFKRVGFVCNENGSIQGPILGDNEEGYGNWDIIVPEQVTDPNFYQNRPGFRFYNQAHATTSFMEHYRRMLYGPTYQRRSTMTTYDERLEVFKDPVQCPCKPTPVTVNQVVDYATKMTMEYFRQEMMSDINFYTKMSHFLTDIRNFATGKK